MAYESNPLKKNMYITEKSCMSANMAISGFLWGKKMTVPL